MFSPRDYGGGKTDQFFFNIVIYNSMIKSKRHKSGYFLNNIYAFFKFIFWKF